MLLCALAAACEHAFEPFIERKEAGFSMFGFLDLHADTQWIRLTPARLSSLLGPEPVDAVVTLEHLESGRVVTLNDSLVAHREVHFDGFDGVGYTHNFWTTEPLEPLGSYRLKATRSDGATTTADITLPDVLEPLIESNLAIGGGSVGSVVLLAEKVVFVDVIEMDSSDLLFTEARQLKHSDANRTHRYRLEYYPRPVSDVIPDARPFVRLSTALLDWPFTPELSDVAVSVQGRLTTNVESGYGFVGGVATAMIPYHRCEVLVPRPRGATNCRYLYDAASASVTGMIVEEPCGRPHRFKDVRLIERFPGGGSAIRHWKTGGRGQFEFYGIEPGTELVLEVRPWSPFTHVSGPLSVPPVPLSSAVAGRRHVVPDIAVRTGC